MHYDHAIHFGEKFMCFSLRRDDCDVASHRSAWILVLLRLQVDLSLWVFKKLEVLQRLVLVFKVNSLNGFGQVGFTYLP